MEVILLLLTIFSNEVLAQDGSVHFRIHVPEIIKHHVHTKTVLVHMEEPERPEHNEESHVEDWSSYNSYNSYNYNDGSEEKHAGGFRLKKKKKKKQEQKKLQPEGPSDDYMPIREEESPEGYGPQEDALPSLGPDNPLGLFGPAVEEPVDPRDRQPGQYKIHEEVEEDAPSAELDNAYNKLLEHGYHRGHRTEHGRLVHKDLKDFYDKEHDELEASRNAFDDEAYAKYAKHGYRANYDKEIGLEQRAGKKHANRRLQLVARLLVG